METNDTQPVPRRGRWKLRLILIGLLVAAVLVLALTPPLLNVNRYQKRIAETMSASLGRPVHLDRVSLHLLPVPGFTLENLVVSEDPAFGSEPVIRANVVNATLRLSSLWTRHVEFSTIRFDVDQNGSGPSLNLVRNAQGRWNLESLLMHASRVDTAPTDQRRAGPAPRFPYIEATGARINLKMGAEKMPFSLTDAEFALWLPTPNQWRVRLEGKPARTDNNVSDPGIVSVEGSLDRAATMAEVPVDLRMGWRGAPLGEASKLLAGEDAGWRGTLHWSATITGVLGKATLHTRFTFNDLRRADFVPENPLDLTVDCTGDLVVPRAVVLDPACNLASPHISATADSLDLTSRVPVNLRVGSPSTPQAWVLEWARLFTQRLPAQEHGAGDVSGSLVYTPTPATDDFDWNGTITGDLGELVKAADKEEPGAGRGAAGPHPSAEPEKPQFTLTVANAGVMLAPLNLMPAGHAPLTLAATITRQSYTLSLNGSATVAQLQALGHEAPPLADGLSAAMPQLKEASDDKELSVNVSCTRAWNAEQTCSAAAPAALKPAVKRTRRRR